MQFEKPPMKDLKKKNGEKSNLEGEAADMEHEMAMTGKTTGTGVTR